MRCFRQAMQWRPVRDRRHRKEVRGGICEDIALKWNGDNRSLNQGRTDKNPKEKVVFLSSASTSPLFQRQVVSISVSKRNWHSSQEPTEEGRRQDAAMATNCKHLQFWKVRSFSCRILELYIEKQKQFGFSQCCQTMVWVIKPLVYCYSFYTPKSAQSMPNFEYN